MNYSSLPHWFSFSLSDLEKIKFMKVSTAKKLIKQNKIQAFRVGNKLFITRDEIVRYLASNITGGVLS